MAIDEALLNCFNPETSLPILRFYSWNPPALSIGRFQDTKKSLNLQQCKNDKIQIVRRITGGGIIYHHHELTYSVVCAPQHIPHVKTIKESYKKLCNFIILAYEKIGLKANYAIDLQNNKHKEKKLGTKTHFCFAGKEEYDIIINNQKIGGNAQKRNRDTIFQHGSVPFHLNLNQAIPFLKHPEEVFPANITSLNDLGIHINYDELKKIMIKTFQKNLSIDFTKSSLISDEKETAQLLKENKYSKIL